MALLVALPMYDVDDICGELAKRRGQPNKPYSRQIVDFWIERELPMAEMIGGRYLLTEGQLNWLATHIGTPKKGKL